MNTDKIGLYFDEHMSKIVYRTLIERGYRVIRAVDVGMTGKDDDTEHLPYATQNHLILVTLDHPFATRTMRRNDFLGMICLTRDIRDKS